jgi:hypothetical protein
MKWGLARQGNRRNCFWWEPTGPANAGLPAIDLPAAPASFADMELPCGYLFVMLQGDDRIRGPGCPGKRSR